jgi:PhnB protein
MTEDRPAPSLTSCVIPYLGLAGRTAEALAFYARAFAATGTETMPDPSDPSRLMHGQTVINGGALMLTDHVMAGTPAGSPMPGGHLQLVVPDGQAWWDRAIAAGCAVEMPFERQFWGDHWGLLRDPFGLCWAILQDGALRQDAAA